MWVHIHRCIASSATHLSPAAKPPPLPTHPQELEKAEASYQRALELLPEDKAIRKGLAAVRKDLADRRATEAGLFKGMFQKAPKG